MSKQWFRLPTPTEVQIRENASIASQLLAGATRPLFRATRHGEPELVASCVLLRIGDHRFLISAAHCFDEPDTEVSQLWVGGAGRMVEVSGVEMRTSSSSSNSRANDRYDVAFISLSAAAVSKLEGCEFLTLEDLDLNDLVTPDNAYLLFGYPWRRSRLVREETRVHYEALFYAGRPVSSSSHAVIGTNADTHYLIGFRRDRVFGECGYVTAPIPRGVSGGGLWRFHSIAGIDPVQPQRTDRLVGIFIEYRSEHDTLIATRIRVVLNLILQLYPELQSLIDGEEYWSQHQSSTA
jgi:hypothetical protein